MSKERTGSIRRRDDVDGQHPKTHPLNLLAESGCIEGLAATPRS